MNTIRNKVDTYTHTNIAPVKEEQDDEIKKRITWKYHCLAAHKFIQHNCKTSVVAFSLAYRNSGVSVRTEERVFVYVCMAYLREKKNWEEEECR